MKKNIVLSVFSLVTALFLTDLVLRHPRIALRFASEPGIYYLNRFPKIHKTLRHSARIQLETAVSGELSWMLGNRRRDRTIIFVTDGLGYRNRKDFRTDIFDTVLLGDSFGFAGSTDQRDLLSEQLNRIGHRVYNLSTAGIGLWDEVVTLNYVVTHERLQLDDGKRVLWLLFEGNDMEGRFFDVYQPERLINGPFRALGVALENYYKRSIIKLLAKRLIHRNDDVAPPVVRKPFFGGEMLFLTSHVQLLERDMDDLVNHPNYENVKNAFRAMGDFARRNGLTVIGAVAPVKARVYEWVVNGKPPWTSDRSPSPFSVFVQSLCDQNGFGFIDLAPALIDGSETAYTAAGDSVYWRNDTHWNDVGQKIAAAVVERSLSR